MLTVAVVVVDVVLKEVVGVVVVEVAVEGGVVLGGTVVDFTWGNGVVLVVLAWLKQLYYCGTCYTRDTLGWRFCKYNIVWQNPMDIIKYWIRYCIIKWFL